MTLFLDEQKRCYAELLIQVGVNLQPNQCLYLSSEIAHRDFVQLAVAQAYRAGAKYVHVDWADPLTAKSRLLYSREDDLDYVPEWIIGQFREYTRDNWARLSLAGEEFPNVFDDVDPARMRRAGVARSRQLRFYAEAIMSMQMQWCVAALPTCNWAHKVFPSLSSDDAVAKLWQLIFATVRLDQDDPVAAWREHDQHLQRVVQFMAKYRVRSLRFLDSTPAEDGQASTDLTIGLTDAPVWVAAAADTTVGARCFPNMPTEEVFTTPHRLRANGWVRTSKPGFPLQREVECATFRFEQGELVEFHAKKGQNVLKQFFEINGARHLGEVALVDERSPINQAGVLFHNTLFDENAVSHIAFGRAYAEGIENGATMNPEQRLEAGVNESDTHCDLMIGTPTMQVIGTCADGSQVTIMEHGQFAAAVFA